MTYISPSQCQQCVPIETTTVHSSHAWSVDLAHEATCPNRKDHQ
jgi:hypothetical protein